LLTRSGSLEELFSYLGSLTKKDSLGLVPTMGSLHQGHLELIKKSKEISGRTIVSIFLNPIQFAEDEDLEEYPKSLSQDLLLCQRLESDFVFTPKVKDLYNLDDLEYSTRVQPDRKLSSCLCGKSRPRLFGGVLTVIMKLLNLTRANLIFLGEKDYQQFLLVEKMLNDFNLKTRLIKVKTHREKSGLASSSRNNYLDSWSKKEALVLFETLKKARELAQANMKFSQIKETLNQENFEYFEARDNQTLELRETPPFRIFIAAKIREVRLIDNLFVG